MSYWDTSALLKLFVVEGDSAAFHQHAAADGERWVTSEWTRLELWTALRRKEAEGFLRRAEAKSLLADFDAGAGHGDWALLPDSPHVHVEFEHIIERCPSQTPPVFIRTLDSLHLAAAIIAGETELVTTDKRLRQAALLFGLALFPPPPA